jgi:hypothetical protein
MIGLCDVGRCQKTKILKDEYNIKKNVINKNQEEQEGRTIVVKVTFLSAVSNSTLINKILPCSIDPETAAVSRRRALKP